MNEPGTAPAGGGPLVDSHCHLQVLAEREGGAGVARALELAAVAGVTQVICPGLNLEDSDRCREIAEAHAGVFFTVGWHPHERAAPDRSQLAALEELLGHPRAVGVGEVGLDQYWRPGYHETSLEVQQAALHQMLELASAHALPAVIHDRESHPEVLAAVDAVAGVRGVMHSFTGDARHAERCRERGFLLSFSGIVTFPRSEAIQEAVRRVDGDGYLVETDTPFLAPVPHRGRPNTPAYVVATAAALARLRGVDPGVVAAQTTASARRLFGLPPEDVLRG
jgi:TatD DNase family protein